MHINDFTARQIEALARKKALHVASNGSIRADEVDDFARDLVLQALCRLKSFDADRGGLTAFLLIVIWSHSLTLLRKRRREQQHGPAFVPFDESGEAAGPTAGVATGGPSDTLSNQEEQWLTAELLAELLADLPQDLRDTAQALMNADGECTEAARALGVSRATVHRRRDELRRIFSQRGQIP